jgi:hypothetical protein
MVDDKKTKKTKKTSKQKNPLEFNGKIYKTIGSKRTAQTKFWNKTIEELKEKEQTKDIKDAIKLIEKKKEQEEKNKVKEYYNNLKEDIKQQKKELKELIKSKSSKPKIERLTNKINKNVKIYNDWNEEKKQEKERQEKLNKIKKEIIKKVGNDKIKQLNPTKINDDNIELDLKDKNRLKNVKKSNVEEIENIITITYDKLFKPYNDKIHKIEIKNMRQSHKDSIITQQIIYYKKDKEGNYKKFNGLLEIYKDNPIYFNSELIKRLNTYDLTPKKFKNFLNTYSYVLFSASDGLWLPEAFLLYLGNNGKVEIITKAYKKIEYEFKDKNQLFKDNIEGTCFYDGIIEYFKSKMDNNRNAKAIYNKIIKNEEEYKKAYTLEDIKLFCEKIGGFSITILDLITGNSTIINDKSTNRFKITFLNTKYNHLDLYVCEDGDIEELTPKEYYEIKNNSKFFIERYGTLYTLNKKYKIKKNDFQIVNEEWKNKYNINSKKIYENSQESELLNTYDFGMHRFFNQYSNNENDYEEHDLKKAYYNYSNEEYNKFYCGVPSGSFLNFSGENFDYKTFEEQYNNKLVGFYQVEIIKHKKNVDDRLGFKIGSIHTLFSSMIKLLYSFVEFKFLNYSISPSFDCPFGEEFLRETNINYNLNDIENDFEDKQQIKYYCKTCGLMNYSNCDPDIKIKALDKDKEFYKTFYDEKMNVYYNDDNGLYEINIIKEEKTLRHIFFTIHSYITTIILNELLNIDLNNVLGVKLDSIVSVKGKFKPHNKKIFGTKEPKLHNMFYDSLDEEYKIINYTTYKEGTQEILNFVKSPLPNNKHIINKLFYAGGAGGTGKTTTILEHMGINLKNICFTSSCWDLIQSKQKEYQGILGLSINKLVGKGCEKINHNKQIIIIDEMTLLNKSDIENVINDNKDKFIFCLGDVDEDGKYYQCSINDNIYKPNENTQYIKFLKSFRFDDELNEKINIIRNLMEQNIDIDKLKNKVKTIFKDRIIDRQKIIFGDNDIGISPRDDTKMNNELTNYFINKGSKPQYYIKTTNLNKNELRGQQIDEAYTKKSNNYEMKLFKTIHSFQGRQLNKEQKIIIHIGGFMFDYNLLYTAISRARTTNQIILFE